jgi:hypothetical protein
MVRGVQFEPRSLWPTTLKQPAAFDYDTATINNHAAALDYDTATVNNHAAALDYDTATINNHAATINQFCAGSQ